jgi:hypothetical protein
MKDAYEKEQEEWMKAYQKLSKITGISIDSLVGDSFCLVKDKEHKLYGEIGVYHHSGLYPEHYFKFGRRVVQFRNGDESKLYWTRNVKILLEEREKLWKLF